MPPIIEQQECEKDCVRITQSAQSIVSKYFGDKWFFLSYLISVSGFFFWISMASKSISFFHLLFFSVLVWLFLFSGKTVLCVVAKKELKATFATSFVVGLIYLNSFSYLLYVFTNLNVLSSYGITILSILVFKCGGLKKSSSDELPHKEKRDSEDSLVCMVAILFMILGVSLWSQQSLNPILINDSSVIYKPWHDSFFHVQFISGISVSDGLRNLQNMSLSGEGVTLYHYAYYFLSAFVKNVTDIDAFNIYCGFLVPFGLFLTCISAFAFIENLFDSSAAFVACILIVIIPSASQMGLSNQWFNYHWLLQVSPGLSYGIAVVTLAWLLMVIGCQNSSYRLVLLGWFVAALSINYKAHIFVANALLIFLYPTLFFSKISIRKRLFVFWVFLSIYSGVLIVSWNVEAFPLIKFDGSAFKDYSSFILSQFETPLFKKFFSLKIQSGNFPLDTLLDISYMSFVLFINTFGIMGVLYYIFAKYKKIDFAYRMLPLLFIFNYMIMALGLAHNNGPGMWEEFMHRPFVWAYFIVTVFIGGYLSVYLRPFIKTLNESKKRVVLILIPFSLLLIPFFLGSDITRGPAWGETLLNTKIDRGLYDVAKYIEKNSTVHDIIQYSRDDKDSFLVAVAERPIFVNLHKFAGNLTAEHKRRLAIVDSISNSKSKKQFFNGLKTNNIKWFVFHKDDSKKIPYDLVSSSVYNSNGYLLFKK